jgi:transposase
MEADRLVKAGQSTAVVSKTLDVPRKTLQGWVKQHDEGKLGPPNSRPLSAEQMELASLCAEIARDST